MDLFKKVKSIEERDKLVNDALAQYNKVPAEHQHLICNDDSELVAVIETAVEIESPTVPTPRSLTAAEMAAQDGRLHFMRIFGDRADDDNVPDWFIRIEEKENREWLEKLVGPQRMAENRLTAMFAEMVEKAVSEALAKVRATPSIHRETILIRPQPMREGIMPKLAGVANEQSPGSDLARFLTAYVGGDEQAMRRVAHELAAA
jgi:hypothetical protein